MRRDNDRSNRQGQDSDRKQNGSDQNNGNRTDEEKEDREGMNS